MYFKKSKIEHIKKEIENFRCINLQFSYGLQKALDKYYLERGKE